MTAQTIATKLHKLVLMLSSPNAGEVIAAAAAIDRTLKQAGTDWHGFAAALTYEPSPPPPPRASPHATTADMPNKIDADELTDLIDEIRAAGVHLTDAAEQYLDDLEDRADRYVAIWLSERQANWLSQLARRAGRIWP